MTGATPRDRVNLMLTRIRAYDTARESGDPAAWNRAYAQFQAAYRDAAPAERILYLRIAMDEVMARHQLQAVTDEQWDAFLAGTGAAAS